LFDIPSIGADDLPNEWQFPIDGVWRGESGIGLIAGSHREFQISGRTEHNAVINGIYTPTRRMSKTGRPVYIKKKDRGVFTKDIYFHWNPDKNWALCFEADLDTTSAFAFMCGARFV
jgi:hypothetical protein